MIVELRVRLADDRVRVGAGVEHQHRVDALFRSDRHADHRRIAHAGDHVEHALDVLGNTFSPSGVTIISFLRPRM